MDIELLAERLPGWTTFATGYFPTETDILKVQLEQAVLK
jgi:hypothetical protein